MERNTFNGRVRANHTHVMYINRNIFNVCIHLIPHAHKHTHTYTYKQAAFEMMMYFSTTPLNYIKLYLNWHQCDIIR